MRAETDPIFLSSDRLASLSDTMFGVAMTLLATTLFPSVQSLTGSALDMLRQGGGELSTVALSFASAAIYWVFQQRRLAMTRSVTPWQTLLHLLFLFLIVLLPITTSLYGRGAMTQGLVMVYGTHLMLLALVNLALWAEVHRRVAVHQPLVASWLVLGVFMVALAVGAARPAAAQVFWFSAFAIPIFTRPLVRRIYRA